MKGVEMEVNRCRVFFFCCCWLLLVVVVVLHLQSLFCFFFITATFFSCAFILPSSRFQFCWFFFCIFFFTPFFVCLFFFFSLSPFQRVSRGCKAEQQKKKEKRTKWKKKKNRHQPLLAKWAAQLSLSKKIVPEKTCFDGC